MFVKKLPTFFCSIFFIFLFASPLVHAGSHFERALENSRKRIDEQRKKMQQRKPRQQIVLKKKEEVDENSLTPHQKKMRERHSKSAEQKRKTISEMDFDELIATKNNHRQAGRYELTLKYLERIILFCDTEEASPFTIEMADVLFDSGELKKAGEKYKEYIELYPGSEHLEYALHQSIVCLFKTTLSPDRDQSRTRETLDLIKKYEDRGTIFYKYSSQIAQMKKECYEKLALSECNICDYYLNQGNLKPLVNRITYIKEHLADGLSAVKDQILAYETRIQQDPAFAPLLHSAPISSITPPTVAIAQAQ